MYVDTHTHTHTHTQAIAAAAGVTSEDVVIKSVKEVFFFADI